MIRSDVRRKIVVVIIALLVGALHFLTGPDYGGPFPVFVNGYMIDILLPFAMYLVLGVVKQPFLRRGAVRGPVVFLIGATSETLQYFGVPLFGRTFDPLDYLMFVIGVGLAMVFEWVVMSRIAVESSPVPDR